jgi:3-dehydroquinate synthase
MANRKVFERLDVSVPGYRYPIIIGYHLLGDSDALSQYVAAEQVMIVTNELVASLYLHELKTSLSGHQCDVVILPDGETYKNQASLNLIYDALMTNSHHRDTTVIALGGGVIGDITGFAAATYQRGVRFINCPTTLLAQTDASIGGKTAINHACGKNMIGSFYQPAAVLIDLNTLLTLPGREFNAGLAEVIKYGLLAGEEFLVYLEEALKHGLRVNGSEILQIVSRSAQIKARYIEADEKEQGSRALLNLGHTFAHALETYTSYQRWLHGEAVAIGLYCAALLSYHMGIAKQSLVERVACIMTRAGLPYTIPKDIDLKQLRQFMQLDKKIKNKRLRFVVLKKPGECYLDDGVTEECLHNTLSAAVEGENSNG